MRKVVNRMLKMPKIDCKKRKNYTVREVLRIAQANMSLLRYILNKPKRFWLLCLNHPNEINYWA